MKYDWSNDKPFLRLLLYVFNHAILKKLQSLFKWLISNLALTNPGSILEYFTDHILNSFIHDSVMDAK